MISCIFTGTVFYAQQNAVGSWWIYFGNKQLSERWNIHHEAQYRAYNFLDDLEQLLIRGGVGYNLTPNNNNLLLGYGFIHNENYLTGADRKSEFNEHRLYAQFITRQQFSRIHLQHRYRFEQRFMPGEIRYRFRYFLAANLPLNNAVLTDNTYYLSAYNEIFIHTDRSVFDRNRTYLGIGYRINSNVRVEAAYLNQSISRKARNQINIATFVNF
ncbi:MAG: DUF2490 domain-containing protein [Weeksellaceae bacterium]|nr:DUF2490 domain-containing protein [Weeksellaceae bacterium]